MNTYDHRQYLRELTKNRFRLRNTITARSPPRYPESAEREYIRTVNAYMRILETGINSAMSEIFRAADEEIYHPERRRDDVSALLSTITAVFSRLSRTLDKRFDDFGLEYRIREVGEIDRKLTVREWKKTVHAVLGLDIFEDYYKGETYRALVDEWASANVDLIKTIAKESLSYTRQLVLDGFRTGRPVKKIARDIREHYGISGRRAKLIARDQTAKLNSQLSQKQMRDGGITEYIWSTVGDSRVRESHMKLNGKRFSWDNPPVVDERTGRRCHPGEDYQCRCVALPVFDRNHLDLPAGKTSKEENGSGYIEFTVQK